MDEKKPESVTREEIDKETLGFTRNGKRLLSPDIIKRMKEAGLSKPDDVTLATWNQVQNMEAGPHTLVAHLAACGVKVTEIAESTGIGMTTVKKYLASESIKFEIRRLQHRYFGIDPQRRFKNLVEDATDVIETTMKDGNVKPSVRIMAAGQILDRAMGKPKQHWTVEGSLIRQVFEALDGKKKDQPLIDVPAATGSEDAPRVVESLPAGENPNSVEKIDKEDNPNLEETGRWKGWVDKNL